MKRLSNQDTFRILGDIVKCVCHIDEVDSRGFISSYDHRLSGSHIGSVFIEYCDTNFIKKVLDSEYDNEFNILQRSEDIQEYGETYYSIVFSWQTANMREPKLYKIEWAELSYEGVDPESIELYEVEREVVTTIQYV